MLERNETVLVQGYDADPARSEQRREGDGLSAYRWLADLTSRALTTIRLPLVGAASAGPAVGSVRAKVEVAERLIARAVDPGARAVAADELRAFPESLLVRAARFPVRLWLLEPHEQVGDCSQLSGSLRAGRWLDGQVGLAECAGLTVRLDDELLVIAPWQRPAVLRHELGHMLGVLLTPAQRLALERCFRGAQADGRLLVGLAGRSVGEYLACGVARYVQPLARTQLRAADPELAALFDTLWRPTSETR